MHVSIVSRLYLYISYVECLIAKANYNSHISDAEIKRNTGFVLVYSITERYTVDQIRPLYDRVKHAKEGDPYFVVVVANKSDQQEKRVVSVEGKIITHLSKLNNCGHLCGAIFVRGNKTRRRDCLPVLPDVC